MQSTSVKINFTSLLRPGKGILTHYRIFFLVNLSSKCPWGTLNSITDIISPYNARLYFPETDHTRSGLGTMLPSERKCNYIVWQNRKLIPSINIIICVYIIEFLILQLSLLNVGTHIFFTWRIQIYLNFRYFVSHYLMTVSVSGKCTRCQHGFTQLVDRFKMKWIHIRTLNMALR